MDGYEQDHFFYGEKFMVMNPEQDEGRLMKVFNTSRFDSAMDTMTSMRNVDVSAGSSIVIWGDN